MIDGNPTVTYSEGLNMGYRWYDANNKTPAFEFGYGLSYTTFTITNPSVSPGANGTYVVSATVTNTGKLAGAEVAQAYVGMPASTGEPPKRLVGFQKISLAAGASQVVKIAIDPNSASHPLGTGIRTRSSGSTRAVLTRCIWVTRPESLLRRAPLVSRPGLSTRASGCVKRRHVPHELHWPDAMRFLFIASVKDLRLSSRTVFASPPVQFVGPAYHALSWDRSCTTFSESRQQCCWDRLQSPRRWHLIGHL